MKTFGILETWSLRRDGRLPEVVQPEVCQYVSPYGGLSVPAARDDLRNDVKHNSVLKKMEITTQQCCLTMQKSKDPEATYIHALVTRVSARYVECDVGRQPSLKQRQR